MNRVRMQENLVNLLAQVIWDLPTYIVYRTQFENSNGKDITARMTVSF